MNFAALYKKIANIDKNVILNECDCMDNTEPTQPTQPVQQDSVNMNVSITGQGSNGIRDLIDMLRHIEKAPDTTKEMPINRPVSSDYDSGEVIVIGEPPIEYDGESTDEHQFDDVDSHYDNDESHYDNDDESHYDNDDESQYGDVDNEPQYGDIDDILVGDMDEELSDDFENSAPGNSGLKTYGIGAVVAMGDDLLSKGKGSVKVNGGENPFAVKESLVRDLRTLYNEIKIR